MLNWRRGSAVAHTNKQLNKEADNGLKMEMWMQHEAFLFKRKKNINQMKSKTDDI